MPYNVGKNKQLCPLSSKPWAVTNQQTGALVGCHPSKSAANKQVAALYAQQVASQGAVVDRSDFLNFENMAGPARRSLTTDIEWRQLDGGKVLAFRGHASTTEQPYDVYGGEFPGWVETMAAGAFKRTLNNHADVVFLVNHTGMALARTKAGTLALSEDSVGLADEARLNPKVSAVSDLYELTRDGNMTEQSFSFRVVRDEWTDAEGEPVDANVGTNRRILEVNMNRGDVSAVNYGANPNTSGGFRAEALAELRDGRLDDAVLERLAVAITEERSMVTDAEMQLQRIEQAVSELRAMYVVEGATDMQGTPLSWASAPAPADELPARADQPDPLIVAYLALHEQLRDPN